MKQLLLLLSVLVLTACTSDNEHFCMRYKYMYDQLDEPDMLPFSVIRNRLLDELDDPNKDHNYTRVMLFVLAEYQSSIKPEDEDAQDYCMRRERWKAYQG